MTPRGKRHQSIGPSKAKEAFSKEPALFLSELLVFSSTHLNPAVKLPCIGLAHASPSRPILYQRHTFIERSDSSSASVGYHHIENDL